MTIRSFQLKIEPVCNIDLIRLGRSIAVVMLHIFAMYGIQAIESLIKPLTRRQE